MRTNHLSTLATHVDPAVRTALSSVIRLCEKAGRLRPIPRAVRRDWARRLDEMGQFEVQDRLSRVTMMGVGKQDTVRIFDAGVTRGKYRFPTRAFVENWLGESQADAETRAAEWRLRLGVVAVVALIAGGLPLVS